MLKVVRSFFRLIHNKPILAVWNITERCNQDCLYCNLHENQNEDKYNELSIEEIGRKIRFLKKMGIEYIYLQGGEPLLRLDIKEIISTMIAHDIKPTIITNGTLLDLSFRDFIKDKNVNLTISLESLDNDVFRKITKNKNLNKKLKMIEKFGNISHKGNWSISTTVTKLNYKEVNNIEKFAKGNGFMYVIRGYVHQIGNAGKFNSNLCYKEIEDEIIELFEEFEKKYKKSNFIASLIYRKYVKYLKGEYNFPCDAGKYSLVINSDGSFSPCIEHQDLNIKTNRSKKLHSFFKSKQVAQKIKYCYENTPCFYGCARNLGILYRNKWKLLLSSFKIVRNMKKYNLFF